MFARGAYPTPVDLDHDVLAGDIAQTVQQCALAPMKIERPARFIAVPYRRGADPGAIKIASFSGTKPVGNATIVSLHDRSFTSKNRGQRVADIARGDNARPAMHVNMNWQPRHNIR